jgi:hypothetical protein
MYVLPYSSDFLDEDDLANIISFLQHDGSYNGDLLHANGRNVTVPLENPLISLYDSVQISGGAYIPMGISGNAELPHGIAIIDNSDKRDVLPPAQEDRQFTHTYHVVEGGKLVKRTDKSPMGSYSQKLADHKLAMTLRAVQIESNVLIVPGVIGKYEFYNLDDGQGGHPTALLFAVPALGERTDSAIVKHLADVAHNRPKLLQKALNEYMPPLMLSLLLLGRATADIHSSGYVHNQLTLGNALAIQNADQEYFIYVAAWETASEIKPGDEELSKLLDLTVAFRSFMGIIDNIKENAPLDQSHADSILSEALAMLLSGYCQLPHEAAIIYAENNTDLWAEAISVMFSPKSDLEGFKPAADLIEELRIYRQYLNQEQE